jgi:hypothetical protein
MTHQASFLGEGGHLSDDGVNLYVDALKLERRQDLPGEVRGHVAECEECKRKVLEIHGLLDGLEYRKEELHPTLDGVKETSPNTFPIFWRVAAGFAVLVGASAVVSYLFTMRTPDRTLTGEHRVPVRDTAAGPAAEAKPRPGLFAANFTESASLQKFVGQDFRAEGVEVVSPPIGATVKQSVRFEWRGELAGPVVLRIVTNREDPVYQSMVRGSMVEVRKDFSPGLYYWKLESNDDLVYVGTFVVKAE